MLVSVVVDEITALVRQQLLVPIRDLAEKIAIFVIFLKDRGDESVIAKIASVQGEISAVRIRVQGGRGWGFCSCSTICEKKRKQIIAKMFIESVKLSSRMQ